MNRINPEFLFSQLGYERRRNMSVEVAKAVGFVAVGALAGAAITALLTPRSGQQLRGDITKTAGQLKERAIVNIASVAVEWVVFANGGAASAPATSSGCGVDDGTGPAEARAHAAVPRREFT